MSPFLPFKLNIKNNCKFIFLLVCVSWPQGIQVGGGMSPSLESIIFLKTLKVSRSIVQIPGKKTLKTG